ncbi:MAG TPA: hypothetical protein VHP33_34675 [Polyangiaceae bacterium]|nr:hypothetical protein [Polyangiaceae bacterium]
MLKAEAVIVDPGDASLPLPKNRNGARHVWPVELPSELVGKLARLRRVRAPYYQSEAGCEQLGNDGLRALWPVRRVLRLGREYHDGGSRLRESAAWQECD